MDETLARLRGALPGTRLEACADGALSGGFAMQLDPARGLKEVAVVVRSSEPARRRVQRDRQGAGRHVPKARGRGGGASQGRTRPVPRALGRAGEAPKGRLARLAERKRILDEHERAHGKLIDQRRILKRKEAAAERKARAAEKSELANREMLDCIRMATRCVDEGLGTMSVNDAEARKRTGALGAVSSLAMRLATWRVIHMAQQPPVLVLRRLFPSGFEVDCMHLQNELGGFMRNRKFRDH